MKLNPFASKKANTTPPPTAILKRLREDNRKAAVSARIAINNVSASGETAIVELLDATKRKDKVGPGHG